MTASRLLLCLSLLIVALVCFGSTRVGWLEREAAASKGTFEIFPPSQQNEIITRRIKARIRVVDQLMAGEVTLVEAAAWFRYLNDTPPDYPEPSWRLLPGPSEGEKLCRQVIGWAEAHLCSRPRSPQLEARYAALKKELADLLAAQRGKVVLPEVGPEA